MDPHSFIARAEAQRWLGIAEKLLLGNDLVGSKTFAIRARESDPRLEAAEQILAVADTLLAAEKRVVGNNGTQQPDFYAILQLVRFVQDTEHIATQYRRLALILNPHQNQFPYSDQAFQFVNDAWAVLSNPMRKSMYDAELNFPPQQQMNPIGFSIEQQKHQHHQQQQQQHQHNFFSISNNIGPGHEQELQEPPQAFQTRAHHSHQQQQLQQHNFLSQPISSRPVPAREQEQLFQLKFSQQQQAPPPPQPTQPQPPMQPTPPPAAPPQPPLLHMQQQKLQQQLQQQPHPQKQQPQPCPQLQQQQQPLQQEQQPQQQDEQQHQEQSPSMDHNAAPVQLPGQVNSNNGSREEERPTAEDAANVNESSTFWTACPYCFYMYEYPRVYAEGILRCDNCKRAFQAVPIQSPPPMVEGQETYFCCWGFFPLGVSISHLEKNKGTDANSNWAPFSPLYQIT